MLDPNTYLTTLMDSGVSFFTGVPDSLLNEICECISSTLHPMRHVIAANEGASVGLAIGHYLGTGSLPLVYLQNSGLGNTINPLISLASPEVYGVPMLVMLGWRGEPGQKDEPQHLHQGRAMMAMLEAIDLSVVLLSDDQVEADAQTRSAAAQARRTSSPVALVVRKGVFGKFERATKVASNLPMGREEAIVVAAARLEERAVVICTTGMASRELFDFRSRSSAGHQRDFLTVGGMGHANQIALGLAMACPDQLVYCFDGDGAALMHMGSMAIIGQSGCANLVHLVFNNGVHGSVGDQPSVGLSIDMPMIAAACGYATAVRVQTPSALANAIDLAGMKGGPAFIEVQVRAGNRPLIGRPTTSPSQNKAALMAFLKG